MNDINSLLHSKSGPISMLPQLKKKTDLPKSNDALASLFSGGPEGDRTLDLQIANLALSQLSYGPL